MKKTIFMLAGISCLFNFTQAQTTHDTGLTTLTNPTGGRALEIRKDNGDGFMTFHDPGDFWYSMGLQKSTGLFKLNYGGDLNTNHLVMNSTGKIGIGTISPKYPLSVAGVLNVEANGDYYGAWFGGEARTANPSLNLGAWHNQRGSIFWNHSDRSLVFETQNNSDVYPNSMVIKHGNVGIGTPSPNASLDVNGTATISGLTSLNNSVIISSNGYTTINNPFTVNNNQIKINTTHKVGLLLTNETASQGVGTLSNTLRLVADQDGDGTGNISHEIGDLNVITNLTTNAYTVNVNTFVNGNIESQKVKVTQTPGNWPDYVFSPDYKLRSLGELEAFIHTNQHLPEVPSANEIEEKGQDLGDIQTTLLKKVEELTLYLIQQDKKNKEQEDRLKKLEAENSELRKLIKAQN